MNLHSQNKPSLHTTKPESQSQARDTAKDNATHLAWFLGPKAENRSLFQDLLIEITDDYMHWRRNYHPEDKVALTKSFARDLDAQSDTVRDAVTEMLAQLRRNFPFYSPRYVAHMLSDVTIPSMLGYFAGMLYNPNNVSTEAAPVTVDMELDACNGLLHLFGLTPPPKPHRHESLDAFAKRLPPRFGWGHTAFDGTIAMLEAFWVARTVKFLPLAIKSVTEKIFDGRLKTDGRSVANYPISHKDARNILNILPTDLILLSPSQSLDLLEQYLENVSPCLGRNLKREEQIAKAWKLLREDEYHIGARGVNASYSEFRPLIYATAASHYSVRKCADVLGLGEDSVITIEMTPQFRMNMTSLKARLREDIRRLREPRENHSGPVPFPLMVIGVCCTTEEGAVDPISDIADFREELLRSSKASFWFHVDAAWGGYIRSLFRADYRTNVDEAYAVLAERLKINRLDEDSWSHLLEEAIFNRVPDPHDRKKLTRNVKEAERSRARGDFENVHESFSDLALRLLESDEYETWLRRLHRLRKRERIGYLHDLTARQELECFGRKVLEADLSWNDQSVLKSFWAMNKADSIVCDPHKMGYCVYPCGTILFADNRVRSCIRHEIPYISALRVGAANLPPRYPLPPEERESHDVMSDAGDEDGDSELPRERSVVVETLGNTILEGSRPGAVATGLWLSSKVIPPTRDAHGKIILSSLRAARMLYEYIEHWEEITKGLNIRVEFFNVSSGPPDSNLVTFVAKRKGDSRLRKMNVETDYIYRNFTIRTELGDREHSYAQTFFLSHTMFQEPGYSKNLLQPFFERAKIEDGEVNYERCGLSVLRAAVMSPYIYPMAESLNGANFIQHFVEELARKSERRDEI